MDKVTGEAVRRVEQSGIVFLDEIDKIAGRESMHGPDVSRQGVQRDLLPIVEGCTVNTKYGMVKTDHILFVASGAFHYGQAVGLDPRVSRPLSDSRRAELAQQRRLRAHSDRAEERADQTI